MVEDDTHTCTARELVLAGSISATALSRCVRLRVLRVWLDALGGNGPSSREIKLVDAAASCAAASCATASWATDERAASDRVRLSDLVGCAQEAADDREARSLSLGQVYEALLGCEARKDAGRLVAARGDHRRRAGVHYTPIDLAHRAARAALDAAFARDERVDDRGDGASRDLERLGSLRIVDLAVGTGGFLIAFLRELRERLLGSGFLRDLPSDERAPRIARHIAEHCLFGVDRDPLAIELARHALALEVPGLSATSPSLRRHVRVGDAVLGESGGTRFECEREFAEAFARPDPGFDFVIGNPPFANGIEERTRLSAEQRAHAQRLYPPFTEGPFDLSLLFWARGLQLVRRCGTYAWISPTALLSSNRPWQAHVHAHCRPTYLELHPVDAFPQARVRTTTFVGRVGTNEDVLVLDRERDELDAKPRRVRWPVPLQAWYEVVEPVGASAMNVPTIALGELCTIGAGCATAAAYCLAALVEDAVEGSGPRLITTGAIDRYRCHWGRRPTRFLGARYDYPRWPRTGGAPPLLERAMSRQAKPKLVVGGLTSVIECYLDPHGTDASVVSTWVLTTQRVPLHALAVVLNSATFSRFFIARHGGLAMNGRQTTIKRAALERMPIPASLTDPVTPSRSEPSASACFERATALGDRALLESAGLALALDAGRAVDECLDDLGHLLAGRLYGRTLEDVFEDVAWFRQRQRQPAPSSVSALVESARRGCAALGSG